MIIEISQDNIEFLERMGLGEGTYPAEGSTDFIFPSQKKDFEIRIFKEDTTGRVFAEIPDAIEPANEGLVIDMLSSEDYGKGKEYPNAVFAVFV